MEKEKGEDGFSWYKFFIGLIISIAILVLCYFIIDRLFMYGIMLDGIFPYISIALRFAIPFILNFIALKSFGKNKSIKRGILVGYVLITIYVIFFAYLFLSPFISQYFKQTGISNQDENYCDKVNSVYDRDNCYLRVAAAKNDSSICDKMSGTLALYDKNSCYSIVASHLNNIELCLKIEKPETKDRCFASFAEKEKDISPCDRVSNQEIKDECYFNVAFSKRDKDFFSKICPIIQIQEHKDDCYVWYAALVKDYSICQNVVEEGKKSMCFNGGAHWS
jgi:hypothetical protein